MSNARNLARLLPNASGQLPATNLASGAAAANLGSYTKSVNNASGDVVLQNLPEFAASKANYGYQKLPSGLIIQWGRLRIPDGGTPTVTFPVSFPNALVCVTTGQMTNSWSSNIYANGWTMDTYNNSYFVPHALTNGTNDFGWVAIGY